MATPKKPLQLKLRKKYITKGGHIVTPIKKCWCGAYACSVRKDSTYLIPKRSLINSKEQGDGHNPPRVHFHDDGRLQTDCGDVSDASRRLSPFDIVAIWEE